MKKMMIATIVAATLTMTGTVSAQGLSCSQIHTLANNTMVARQNGESMVDMMESADVPGEKMLIQMAFKVPRYNTMEYKRNAVTDFANQMAQACYAQQ